MKILGIVPYRFLPALIGGQKAIEQLYRSLGKKVPVIVVSTKNNEAKAASFFSLVPLFSHRLLRYGNFFYLKKIGNIIQQQKITHLFTEHPYMAWMGLYLKKKYNLSFIIHAHNIESIRFKSIGKKWWKLLWYYERQMYRSADFVFFMTENDRQYAIEKYGVLSQKAITALYGTEVKESPSPERRREAKNAVCRNLEINSECALLFFNGSFDYAPNSDALRVLMKTIVPQLNQISFSYKLIICGRNIPSEHKETKPDNVIFLDYVDDIFQYNLAADVFLNPVLTGGGIKTKLVEALAAGANAVSTKSGAIGVDAAWCNHKLFIINDDDWKLFTEQIVRAATNKTVMSKAFYDHFFIDNITDHIIKKISE